MRLRLWCVRGVAVVFVSGLLVGVSTLVAEAPPAAAQPPSGGTVTECCTGIPSGADPTNITAGPDGNLWFTEPGSNEIGRITPTGRVTQFSAGQYFFGYGNTQLTGTVFQVLTDTSAGPCQLTASDVEQSAKYQALAAGARGAIDHILAGACSGLATITTKQLALAIAAYKAAVTALAKGGWLTASQATALTYLASNLTLPASALDTNFVRRLTRHTGGARRQRRCRCRRETRA
jgi:hypothetical protein